MIPYKDENPTHHIPYVTYAIIVLNIAVWVFIQGMGKEPLISESICRYGLIPGAVLGVSPTETSLGFCQVSHQSWTVAISSMFMHGGWIHLLGNMWFLWLFADNIEDVLRPVKFILFYLLGGIAAIAAQVISDFDSVIPMVGASGAIGGVMGAYAWLYPTIRVRMAIILGFFIFRRTIPAWVMLGIWLVIQFLSAFLAFTSNTQGGIAFWAHIGGFITGFLAMLLIYKKPPRLPDLH